MGPGYPTCRRSPRSWPPPCPPASAPAGAAPPRPPGAGWRAVTWPPGGTLSRAFRKGIPSAASRVAPAPRRPGTRPGPCTAPRPSAGCGRSDGGHRARPRRNDGSRATRRQAFPRPPHGPSPRPSFRPSPEAPARGGDTLSTSRRYSYPYPSHGPCPIISRIVRCPFAGSRSRSEPHPGPCFTTPGTGTVNGSIPGPPTLQNITPVYRIPSVYRADMRYGPVHFDSRTPGWLAAARRSGEAGRHPLACGLCGRGNRRGARGGGENAARPGRTDQPPDSARAADIGRVVRDHRSPILPGVRVHEPGPGGVHLREARPAR